MPISGDSGGNLVIIPFTTIRVQYNNVRSVQANIQPQLKIPQSLDSLG